MIRAFSGTRPRILGHSSAHSRALIAHGVTPSVGTPVPLTAGVAARAGQPDGLRVVEVVTGSPADRAGLRAGDLVLSAARRPVTDAQSLQRLLFDDAIGQPLPVTVLRSGAMVDVIAVPGELTGVG